MNKQQLLDWAVNNLKEWPYISEEMLGKPLKRIRKSLPETPQGFVWCSWGSDVDVALIDSRETGQVMITHDDFKKCYVPVPTPAPAMPAPIPREDVQRHLNTTLANWPTESTMNSNTHLDEQGGWLWTLLNGLPAAYCPGKEWYVTRADWEAMRVPEYIPPRATRNAPPAPPAPRVMSKEIQNAVTTLQNAIQKSRDETVINAIGKYLSMPNFSMVDVLASGRIIVHAKPDGRALFIDNHNNTTIVEIKPVTVECNNGHIFVEPF